ncbi:hypothetical protein C4D60_Mb05t25800 [Musa balbisiana]|uniref:Kinesin motor domain-containing protein n=1 Tax=Musa balbisiana TaxID=52838 RepID=A0A4S8JYV6_MUSBA|nr:hypothetical protein C4D60_Mb05t25800 [Musa balbisiana]
MTRRLHRSNKMKSPLNFKLVQIGSHAFTFDHVYGSSGSPYSSIFKECVLPLIDALFHGYNATVLAYGQTGSGKTYTMGTNYTGEGNCGGIIPEVMDTIFTKIDAMKTRTEFLVRVSFIEIFKEEVFDLLDPQSHAAMRTEGAPIAKPTLSRAPIQIRETAAGGITLAGVTEAEVRSKEEMASYLTRGSISRATGSTNMNSQSSRSHAIFTIYMEQKNVSHESHGGMVNNEAAGDDILFAKFHLVDLAGSERAKRTGADGLRLKEACISPADSNAEETINTLKYANRARNIQNKAMINRDPVAAEMQRMRSQLEQLQAELLFCRGGGAPLEELQLLQHKISLLEASNAELRQELKERQVTCELLRQSALDAQVEKDKLTLKIESARGGKSWDEIDKMEKNKELDLVKGYISKIQELEAELLRVQSFSHPCRNLTIDADIDDMASGCDEKTLDVSIEAEEEEKEREHSMLQDQLDKEIQELDKRLEQKEAEMKQFTRVDTTVLKQHYEKKLLELEQEKKLLTKEIEHLRFNLSNMSSTTDESAQKLREDYLQKLNMLETQVSELKKKQEAQAQLLRQKQKSDEAAKRLQEEIQRIKSQKVQLQHKMKQESEQFRSWKVSREKEVLQVLQRKTEEAALATKRLKELLEAKKSTREASATGNANGPGIQVLVHAIEHELEVTLRVHEVRSEYERQMKERAAMAKEVAKLKEESETLKQKIISDSPQTMSPSARDSRIVALENMLKTSSTALVSMASQLSEAEERERVFSAYYVAFAIHRLGTQLADAHAQNTPIGILHKNSFLDDGRAAMAKEVAKLKEESETLKQKIISDSPQTMSPSARDSRIVALENMLKTSSTALVSMASQLSEAEERERVFSGKGRWNQVRSLADAKNLMNYLFNLASSSRCELRDKEVSCREKDSEIAELKDKVVKLNILKRQLEEQLLVAHNQNMQILSIKKVKKTTGISGTDIGVSKEDKLSDVIHKNPQSIRCSGHGVNNLDDMDISDTEMSDVFETDAEASEEFESDVADEDWIESRKKIRKKQFPNYQNRKSTLEDNIPVGNLSEKPNEEGKIKVEKIGFEHCCSCSRVSSCKTKRCECRALGSVCSTYCGCVPSKCSNREGGLINSDMDEISNSEAAESGGSLSSFDHVDDDTSKLVSEGTLLLQSALSKKTTTEEKNVKSRKPLSDIGNNVIKPNAAKQGRRKKWRKSTIQLVLTEPLQSSFPQDNEAPRSREDVPLRLPRAMDSMPPENNHPPLGNRNSSRAGESVNGNKEVRGIIPPRSPVRMRKASDEKENHMA